MAEFALEIHWKASISTKLMQQHWFNQQQCLRQYYLFSNLYVFGIAEVLFEVLHLTVFLWFMLRGEARLLVNIPIHA